MAMLDEIAKKLADLGLGSVTAPITLFCGEIPAHPVVCGAVYGYGGAPGEFGIGVEGLIQETPGIQVVFRGAPDDSEGPRAKAQTALEELAKVEAETLSAGGGGTSAFYHWIHPQGSVFKLKKDENQRVYMAVNFLATKERSA